MYCIFFNIVDALHKNDGYHISLLLLLSNLLLSNYLQLMYSHKLIQSDYLQY